jgi:hypothetical protein
MAPKSAHLTSWEALRGKKVCLIQGSFYNKELQEKYGVDGVAFPGTAEAYAALKNGNCVGFAYDDTAIIITSDHGEDLGELGLYAEHALADELTTRIPMIIKWPGVKPREVAGLHYNIDLLPTLAQLLSVRPGEKWDGKSYAPSLLEGADCGRDYLVLSQMAHVCQRSVRMGDWLYMRTYHGGLHLFGDEMLFNLRDDPHEKYDVIEDHPEIAGMCARILLDWHAEMMAGVADGIDPMETVLREGGPLHSRGYVLRYAERLRETGRAEGAEEMLRRYPPEKNM